MSSEPTPPQETPDIATADIKLKLGSRHLQIKVSLPVIPTSPRALLPLAQQLSNAKAKAITEDAVAQGKEISCCAGCGACCRQMVPVTAPEAQRLVEVVEALPEPRQTEIRRRFKEAREQLAANWEMKSIFERGAWTHGDYTPAESVAIARSYFQMRIACPFLEDESCSIYLDRPVICREYLVVSDPKGCAAFDPQQIHRADLPFGSFMPLAVAENGPDSPVPVIPLVLALDWAANHPEREPTQTGPVMLQRFFEEFTSQKVPPFSGALLQSQAEESMAEPPEGNGGKPGTEASS